MDLVVPGAQVLRSREASLQQSLAALEKDRGVSGFRDTTENLERVAEQKAGLDERKGADEPDEPNEPSLQERSDPGGDVGAGAPAHSPDWGAESSAGSDYQGTEATSAAVTGHAGSTFDYLTEKLIILPIII